jgi:hypothetical protein
MPENLSEAARNLVAARWKNTTPEQRKAHSRMMHRALILKEIEKNLPEFTAAERTRLAQLLLLGEGSS